MAYLAVDKDGTELIFDTRPMRRRNLDGSRIKGVMWGAIKVVYSKNKWNKWCNAWSNDEHDALPQFGIKLPKGTINNILGYNINWTNEPVEI